MKHGGPRAGAGRPPKQGEKVKKITIALYDRTIVKFLAYAKRFKSQRAAFEELVDAIDEDNEKAD
jgi:hypothetical protein